MKNEIMKQYLKQASKMCQISKKKKDKKNHILV